MWEAVDLVTILEAAYAVDRPERAWLQGLIDAMRPVVEDGLGMAAYLYDTTDRPFRIRQLIVDGCPVDAAGLAMLQDASHDDYVRSSWIARSAMMASETPGYATHPGVLQVFHPAGIHDILVVNALDPVGVGCWIGAPVRKLRELTGPERERWNRVAAHVRASLRLRLRLAAQVGAREEGGDAVLEQGGKVVHLEPSVEDARDALRQAVLDMQRARTVLRDQPDRALSSWKALVRARWSLVDQFQANGDVYIVARSNALDASATSRLSWRERQVVACLAMGQTNKEAAYELGLSHSTVRVLVARACAKLGSTTREHLVATYRLEALGQPG